MKKRILFICLGNICRSPTAEAIFSHQLKNKKLHNYFVVDSAGTSNNHVGEASDPRSIQHANKRGYLMNHKARQFTKEDFEKFDYLVCMDDQNYKNVLQMCTNDSEKSKVKKMAHYLKKCNDSIILDPWPLGPEAFEKVIDLLEDGCEQLINELNSMS